MMAKGTNQVMEN